MSETIRVPDIGSGEGEVIELFVKVGDRAYTVIDADPEAAEIDPETGAAAAGLTGPWYERLGDSLAAADARPEARRQ